MERWPEEPASARAACVLAQQKSQNLLVFHPPPQTPLSLHLLNAAFPSAFVPQGASALFDMIEYYESATHLNISFNKHIGTRGWQAAAHMMRKVCARAGRFSAPAGTPWGGL